MVVVVILVILAIYLLYLLVVYVLIPIAGVASLIVLAIGVLYAFCISVYSFFKSLVEHINPYATYKDKSKNAPEGIKRNYFFGPGYYQISSTVKGAFSNLKGHLSKLTDLRNKLIGW